MKTEGKTPSFEVSWKNFAIIFFMITGEFVFYQIPFSSPSWLTRHSSFEKQVLKKPLK